MGNGKPSPLAEGGRQTPEPAGDRDPSLEKSTFEAWTNHSGTVTTPSRLPPSNASCPETSPQLDPEHAPANTSPQSQRKSNPDLDLDMLNPSYLRPQTIPFLNAPPSTPNHLHVDPSALELDPPPTPDPHPILSFLRPTPPFHARTTLPSKHLLLPQTLSPFSSPSTSKNSPLKSTFIPVLGPCSSPSWIVLLRIS